MLFLIYNPKEVSKCENQIYGYSIEPLPGFGLPLDEEPEFDDMFPVMRLASQDSGRTWLARTLTIREVLMLAFVEEITNKPEWWRKVKDTSITNKWKSEALSADWSHINRYGEFVEPMADAVRYSTPCRCSVFLTYFNSVSASCRAKLNYMRKRDSSRFSITLPLLLNRIALCHPNLQQNYKPLFEFWKMFQIIKKTGTPVAMNKYWIWSIPLCGRSSMVSLAFLLIVRLVFRIVSITAALERSSLRLISL